MTQTDLLFISGIVFVTFILAVIITKLFSETEKLQKQIGVSIPDPKKEEKKEIRTFTNIPPQKAGPIKRPTAEQLEMRKRSKEEKETSDAWKEKLEPYQRVKN